MQFFVVDKNMKRTIGVIHDVLVKVEPFIYSADFVIHYWEVDFEVPIILGRPFIAMGYDLYDMEKGQMNSDFKKSKRLRIFVGP